MIKKIIYHFSIPEKINPTGCAYFDQRTTTRNDIIELAKEIIAKFAIDSYNVYLPPKSYEELYSYIEFYPRIRIGEVWDKNLEFPDELFK